MPSPKKLLQQYVAGKGPIAEPVEVRTRLLSILLACLALASNSLRRRPRVVRTLPPRMLSRAGKLFRSHPPPLILLLEYERQFLDT